MQIIPEILKHAEAGNNPEKKCNQCERVFKTLLDLENHILVTHRPVDTFTCIVKNRKGNCGKIFLCKSKIIDHLKNDHK